MANKSFLKVTDTITGKPDNKSFKKVLLKTDLVKNFSTYMLLLPAILFIVLFSYLPMLGIVIAFQDYDPFQGLFGSAFVGFQNFSFFFRGSAWLQVTVNTLYLNLLFIISGTIASVLVAVLLTSLGKNAVCKTAQTLMTLPNFISWATVALFSVVFLSGNGIINSMVKFMGADSIAFYSSPEVWPWIFTIIRIWKGAGWGAIVYMAAIVGIDSEIYEAAKIDGCSKFKAIFKVTLPLIKNTIVLLAIMSVGNIFRGDFGMIYPFIGDNALLYPTTDVIDTYLFRALRTSTNMGMNMAIGIYQNVMGFVLVFGANYLARKFAPESAIF